MMIDWITAEVSDPVGVPVNAGQVVRVSRDGQVEWSVPTRLSVEGSHSSNMTFRAIGAEAVEAKSAYGMPGHHSFERVESGLEVSGNPAKFLTGHNLFGSDDAGALLSASIAKAHHAIWPDLAEPPAIDVSEAVVSRIDLTGSWILEREAEVMPFLQALEQRVWVPYRGRGVFDSGGSTLYFGRADKGKRAKAWALKLYWKGPEITAHPLPRPAYEVPGMLDELNRTIRVELTLRTPELKRLGLQKVGQWTAAKVREIWEAYVSKLEFGEATVNLDTVDLAALGLRARHVAYLAAWRAGNDLRSSMSKTAFYRLRSELRAATGFDIAVLAPKSNVVPLRRVIVASVAPRPVWADVLTEALGRAA